MTMKYKVPVELMMENAGHILARLVVLLFGGSDKRFQVIDYTKEDFTKSGQRYDLIIDAVGNRSVSDYKRALSPRGICVIIGYSSPALPFQVLLLGPWRSMTGSKKIGILLANINKRDLVYMSELLEAGKVKPVIDRRYPLSEVAEALRYLEEGHARGKAVITVEPINKT